MSRKKIQYKNYHIVSNISNETPLEDSPVDEEVDGIVIEHRWHDKEMAKAWLILFEWNEN